MHDLTKTSSSVFAYFISIFEVTAPQPLNISQVLNAYHHSRSLDEQMWCGMLRTSVFCHTLDRAVSDCSLRRKHAFHSSAETNDSPNPPEFEVRLIVVCGWCQIVCIKFKGSGTLLSAQETRPCHHLSPPKIPKTQAIVPHCHARPKMSQSPEPIHK